MEDTWWEMPPPLLTELGSTPYNGTYRGTVLLEVLGTGARISIDILELGSFPSWQGGQLVWAVILCLWLG